MVVDRDDVHLQLDPTRAEERAESRRDIALCEVGGSGLEQPVPHLIADAVGHGTHEVGDPWRARAVRRGEVTTCRVIADLGRVGVEEALPVRFLAVVASWLVELEVPVAAVRELRAALELAEVGLQKGSERWIRHQFDRLEGHPRVRRHTRGSGRARHRQHRHQRQSAKGSRDPPGGRHPQSLPGRRRRRRNPPHGTPRSAGTTEYPGRLRSRPRPPERPTAWAGTRTLRASLR